MTVPAYHFAGRGTGPGGAAGAGGRAHASTRGEGGTFTTVALKIKFLRPSTGARLIAEGTIVQQGRTAGMAECSVTDENGRLIAKATSTCLTLRGDQAKGR